LRKRRSLLLDKDVARNAAKPDPTDSRPRQTNHRNGKDPG
jgi:hypothetical protein